jgi:GT2 family glycosyltransferase
VSEPRTLVAVLVYNGREVTLPCLESMARLRGNVDLLVLDDCSPLPGWSAELAERCEKLEIQYYRSPRNLGIPRNMNLAMLRGVTAGYDSLAIVNSDVVLSESIVEAANDVLFEDLSVASVTPWSNNVSIFSLPMATATPQLRSVEHVDLVASALRGRFGTATVEIPTGVGYCMFMRSVVVQEVGLMDTIFGRGYCEEVDWCQRARRAGYRHVLGLGSFAFHHGGATNREAGLLAAGHTTVIEHEAIVDYRYPTYRADVLRFQQSSRMAVTEAAMAAIVTTAARELGYVLDIAEIDVAAAEQVTIRLAPSGALLGGRYAGLGIPFDTLAGESFDEIESRFGLPGRVRIFDRGFWADRAEAWAAGLGIPCLRSTPYPSRV